MGAKRTHKRSQSNSSSSSDDEQRKSIFNTICDTVQTTVTDYQVQLKENKIQNQKDSGQYVSKSDGLFQPFHIVPVHLQEKISDVLKEYVLKKYKFATVSPVVSKPIKVRRPTNTAWRRNSKNGAINVTGIKLLYQTHPVDNYFTKVRRKASGSAGRQHGWRTELNAEIHDLNIKYGYIQLPDPQNQAQVSDNSGSQARIDSTTSQIAAEMSMAQDSLHTATDSGDIQQLNNIDAYHQLKNMAHKVQDSILQQWLCKQISIGKSARPGQVSQHQNQQHLKRCVQCWRCGASVTIDLKETSLMASHSDADMNAIGMHKSSIGGGVAQVDNHQSPTIINGQQTVINGQQCNNGDQRPIHKSESAKKEKRKKSERQEDKKVKKKKLSKGSQ